MTHRQMTHRLSRHKHRLTVIVGVYMLFMVSIRVLPAHADAPPLEELTQLSLEKLLNVEITSVSTQPHPLAQTTAAIFVLTREYIQRSGATSIPEALRMVPGLQVPRLNSNK